MTDLFKAGVSLLGAGVVLKLTKDMSDNLTKPRHEKENKECPREIQKNKRRYFRL